MMTKELHDKLTKYESIFKCAIEAKYYRAMDSKFAADFIAGCHEMNVYINPSCSACVLKALQTLGQLYFDYQEPAPETPADADKSETGSVDNVQEKKPKQPKKPVVIRSKTNKK